MLRRGMFTPAKNSTRGCQCMEMHPYGYLRIGAIWRLCMCILASVCLCVCFHFFPEKLMYGDTLLRRIYVLFLPFNISCLCLPLEAVMSTEAAFSSPQEQWSVEPGY